MSCINVTASIVKKQLKSQEINMTTCPDDVDPYLAREAADEIDTVMLQFFNITLIIRMSSLNEN